MPSLRHARSRQARHVHILQPDKYKCTSIPLLQQRLEDVAKEMGGGVLFQ